LDLEAVLHQLEEAKELEDWDMIEESIELIRAIIDDYDEYQSEEDWG
jgi:flagellin-specific chaperone FliS